MANSLRDGKASFGGFFPIIVANVFPLVGFILPMSDMSLHSVYLLYWFELLTLFLVYCGCALFAQQEQSVEDYYGSSGLGSPSEVQVHEAVPPVQLHHVGFVGRGALVMCVFLLCAGALILNTLAPYDSFLAWFSVFTDPIVFLSTLGIGAAHLTYAYRNYFQSHRYREVSPEEVLIPRFYFTLLFCAVTFAWILAFAFVGAVTLSAFSQPIADVVAGAVLFGGFFGMKIWLEWIQFQTEHAIEPRGIAGWVIPASIRTRFPD